MRGSTIRRASQETGRRQAAGTRSFPAPVGGWNARDSLADMHPADAVILENWWPTTSDVVVRKGQTNWATGTGGAVQTLVAYNAGISSKMFAFSGVTNASVYDVTSSGAVGAAKVTGLSNAQWEHVNFSTPGGSFVVAVNGTDSMLQYNGTNWYNITTTTAGATISTITNVTATATMTTATPHGLITGNTITVVGALPAAYNGTFVVTVTGASTLTYTMLSDPGGNAAPVGTYSNALAITGFDTKNAYNISIFKNRVFMIEKNSLKWWYLGTSAIAGAAASFDLGSVFRYGGYLVAMGTWSLDGGYGMDDYAVFITSQGEVAVYSGTDPSSSTTWNLVGVYSIGSPMGKRCMMKYQGDLLVICKDGIAPMSKSLMSSRVNSRTNLSDKIQWAMSLATSDYDGNYGWETMIYPDNNMVIVNIPVSTTAQEQYVMNAITGAWCKFTGYAAYCWEYFNNEIYFGTDGGNVVKAWTGNNDNGAGIVARALPAFSYFGNPTTIKRWTMARPILSTTGSLTVNMTLNTDFNLTGYGGLIGYSTQGTNLWDTAKWDGASWSTGVEYKRDWQTVAGVGYSAAVQLVIGTVNTEVRWVSTDYVFENGGVL